MPRRSTIARPADRRRSSPRRPVARAPVTTVVVAVPARDEAASVAACLRSIDRAAAAVGGIRVVAVVAADRCHDATAACALATPTAHMAVVVVEGSWRGPGAARAAAVEEALSHVRDDPGATWIASTDADCVVADDWLHMQLVHAAAGCDATAGIVRLDLAAPAWLRAEFAAVYGVTGAFHRHVHAANLGVRASAYLAVDGWSPHAVVGEDHNLWRRLRRTGHALVQPVDVVVTTSARTHSRVIGGFASALARLEQGGGPAAVRTA